jgi:hypothetical protein
VLDAMLLQWLTGAIGMPATVAGPALKDLQREITERSDRDAVVISRTIGGREWSVGAVWLSHLGEWVSSHPDMAHVVFSLKGLRELL